MIFTREMNYIDRSEMAEKCFYSVTDKGHISHFPIFPFLSTSELLTSRAGWKCQFLGNYLSLLLSCKFVQLFTKSFIFLGFQHAAPELCWQREI